MDNENMRDNENINENDIEICDETVLNEEVDESFIIEEDIDNVEVIDKPKFHIKPLWWIVSGAAAVLVAIIVYCICVVNGVGSQSIVANPVESEGYKALDLKYENPVMTLFSKMVLGNDNTVVATVNDKNVDADFFQFIINTLANNYISTMLQEEKYDEAAKLDWNKIHEKSGLMLKEYVKGGAIETIVPVYALINEGEKRGIRLTDTDIADVNAELQQTKATYGSNFPELLKLIGCDSEETFVKNMQLLTLQQLVVDDFEKDPSKYISDEEISEYVAKDGAITVKHILVKPDSTATAEYPDVSKAEAKKKAEEALSRVKAGEDFDKLIEIYGQDPGQTEDGYTFAQDGQMVKEFEDAAFKLKEGEVSGLVESEYGYHIIKRVERAVSVDDYLYWLRDNAKVRLKKKVYDNMTITLDMNLLFGGIK